MELSEGVLKMKKKLSDLLNPENKVPNYLQNVTQGRVLFHVLHGEVVVIKNNNKGNIRVRDNNKAIHQISYDGRDMTVNNKYPSVYVTPFCLDKRMLRVPLSPLDLLKKDDAVFVSNNGLDYIPAHFAFYKDKFYVYPHGTSSFTSSDKDARGFRYLKDVNGKKFFAGDLKVRKEGSYELDFNKFKELIESGYAVEVQIPSENEQATIIKDT